MINVLSYIGMNFHSEVCLWTLLGLMRTIFDATLFRVNANLKQVWQMSMPEELSMSVQRVLRTMISGVMLAQCFTVYVYLASYIVVLYPVFLEERPNLVLPWLLLAAVRKLLCELMSLALGLGTCVLLGPARPPCIKFVIIKLISIMPAFYMWMLMYSYYHTLKVAAAFKTFPAVLPACDQDYGLELAIRRRKTKSLLGEAQLRSKLVASLYGDECPDRVTSISKIGISSRMMHSTDTSAVDIIKMEEETEVVRPNSLISNQMSDTGSCDDWFGSEIALPRGSDRILDQFALMLLKIGAYLNKEGRQSDSSHMLTCKSSYPAMSQQHTLNCMGMNASDVTDTPLLVSSSKEKTAQYLREYPHIFMRKTLELPRNDNKTGLANAPTTRQDNEDNSVTRNRKRAVTVSSKEKVSSIDKGVSNTIHDQVQSRDSYINIQSTTINTDEILLKYTDMYTSHSPYSIGIKQSSESILKVSRENVNECQGDDSKRNSCPEKISIQQSSEGNLIDITDDVNLNPSSYDKLNNFTESISTSTGNIINESAKENNTQTNTIVDTDKLTKASSKQLINNDSSNNYVNNYHEDINKEMYTNFNNDLEGSCSKRSERQNSKDNLVNDKQNIYKEKQQLDLNESTDNICNEICPNKFNIDETVEMENSKTEDKSSGPEVEELSSSSRLEHEGNHTKSKTVKKD